MAPARVLTRMRAIAVALGTAGVAVLVVLAPTTHAYAAPDPATIEAQIDAAWNKLEPVIEQYNGVHSQLKANQAKTAALQKQIMPLQLQVDLAMSRVSEIAVAVYKGGRASQVNAVLSAGSADSLATQLSLLDQIARGQHDQISTVATARDKYAADKKVLDDLVAQLASQDADLAAKKKQIETEISNLQKLRQQVYGSSSGTGSLKPVACPVVYLGGAAGKAASTACAQIGKPYVWGADGPGSFDCSGLTMYAWAAAGVSLPHYTLWQWQQTTHVSTPMVGDLVFFYSDRHHVGIYVGDGWIVHAPHPGDYVRMARMSVMPLNGISRPG